MAQSEAAAGLLQGAGEGEPASSAAEPAPAPAAGAPKKRAPKPSLAGPKVWVNEHLDGPCGNVFGATAFYVALGVAFFYASGLNYIFLNILTQAGVQPTAGLLAFLLPVNAALGRDATAQLQYTDGYVNTDPLRGMVFFEALPAFIVAIGVEVAGAFLVFGRRLHRANDSMNSISMGLLDQLSGAAIGSMLIGPYSAIHSRWALLRVDWTTNALAWWGGFLALDLCYYAFHRGSHGVNLLWASHVVHHSSQEYNLTTALRQSFWGNISFVFYLPLAFVFPLQLALAHKVINLLFQFWIHTRTVGQLWWPIEFIFNTPSHHRVHHGRNPKCVDKNFAGTLIIWDRLFGTFQGEEGVGEEIKYGIVPPLGTWNPVWGQVHHYVDMAQLAHSMPGWHRKLQVPLRPPGWRWDARKGVAREFKVPRIGHPVNPPTSYDPPVAPFWLYYAGVQFAVMLGTYFVLLTALPEDGSLPPATLGGAYTGAALAYALGLTAVGWALEGHPWGLPLELLRLPLWLCGTVGLLAWAAAREGGVDAAGAVASAAASPVGVALGVETVLSAAALGVWHCACARPAAAYAALPGEGSSPSGAPAPAEHSGAVDPTAATPAH